MLRAFNNLKLRSKFLVIGLVILPLLLILSAVGVWGVTTINNLLQQTQQQQLPSIYDLAEMSEKVQLTRNANRQVLAEIDLAKITQVSELALKNQQLARQHWEAYLKLPSVEEERQLWPLLETEWQAWQTETAEVLQLAQKNTLLSHEEALDELAKGHGQSLTDLIDKLIAINYKGAVQLAQQSDQTFPVVIAFVIITASAVIILSLLSFILLARSITQPLFRLEQATQALAEGDLTCYLSLERRDELGHLAQTYNTTLKSLQALVKQLFQQSYELSQATSELTAQAQSQVTGNSQQASAITEASQALQELKQTAGLIAQEATRSLEVTAFSFEQARMVSELADYMAEAQTEGHQTLNITIHSVQNLGEQIGKIKEEQQNLLAQSGVIHTVIKMINDLANQTHLLALNAAIEAAGAGVMGDRFAVIAGEVKQLADHSLKATKEVGGALDRISQTIERTNQMTSFSLTEAKQAIAQSGNATEILFKLNTLSQQVKVASTQIVENLQASVGVANTIGTTTRQQLAANQQILEKMLEIEAISAQTLNNVRQGEIVTRQLDLSAHDLAHSAGTFKLEVA
jgi:methyl-accepting chemotaxis protein